MSVQFSKGLEDVIADQTSISNVEGDLGRLSYRGYTIEQLVTLSFTRVVWLVLFGELATAAALAPGQYRHPAARERGGRPP